MSDAPTTSAADREIVVSRLIDAPVERVWRAWADASEVARWWGPYGFTTDTGQRDFRPGGVWRHTMIGPDGTPYLNVARFEEIVPHERIVYTNGGGTEGRPGVHFRSTVTFVDRGGKTELMLRLVFDTAAMREQAATRYGAIEGGRQTLSRLAAQVQGEFLVSRLVDAPRARVWKAWTDPAELAAWFGPRDFETFKATLDFRVGGTYHYGIRSGDLTVWGKWTFREIDEPGRLQVLQSFSDERGGIGRHPLSPTWPVHTLSTILLEDKGAKTLVTVHWAPYEAPDAERETFRQGAADMQQGWRGTFERLDAFLAEHT